MKQRDHEKFILLFSSASAIKNLDFFRFLGKFSRKFSLYLLNIGSKKNASKSSEEQVNNRKFNWFFDRNFAAIDSI